MYMTRLFDRYRTRNSTSYARIYMTGMIQYLPPGSPVLVTSYVPNVSYTVHCRIDCSRQIRAVHEQQVCGDNARYMPAATKEIPVRAVPLYI